MEDQKEIHLLGSVNNKLDLREVNTTYLKIYDTHWNHRIKNFSFFIAIEVVLFGAYASLVFDVFESKNNGCLTAIIAAAICLVAVILFSLDQKIKKVINLTCLAMRRFEELYEADFPPEMRLMSNIKNSVAHPDMSILFWLSYGFVFVAGCGLLAFSFFIR